MSHTETESKKDPFDGEYIGNIWGWRNSFIGLGFILFMFAILFIRMMTMKEPAVDPIEESAPKPPLENEKLAVPQ
ncbi:MAG: hypothetical protein R2828_05265 [Saprospiraceae bacterium]